MRLYLIKHCAPTLDDSKPASLWRLSSEGLAQARQLADRLAGIDVEAIYYSPEPKAFQTAAALGGRLALAPIEHPGLVEHQRPAGLLPEQAFHNTVAQVFAERDEAVFGIESANDALGRFCDTMSELRAAHAGDLAIVAHGTVISLFAESVGAVRDAHDLWTTLTLPSIVVLEDGELVAVEAYPPRTFQRDDPSMSDEEIARLREDRDLGRLGDALRAIGDPSARDVLRRAVRESDTDAERTINRLRLAIARRYANRLFEAVDEFDAIEPLIDEHCPSHRHLWCQHFGKCLVEAGRIAEARDRFDEALTLREDLGDDFQESTRRALAALPR